MNKSKIMVTRRDNASAGLRLFNILLFVILALAFCSIFMLAQGFNPITVYAKMFKSAFGSFNGWAKSIQTGVPLMICGLGVSIAFKMNMNNIGAEGQYIVGALTATVLPAASSSSDRSSRVRFRFRS